MEIILTIIISACVGVVVGVIISSLIIPLFIKNDDEDIKRIIDILDIGECRSIFPYEPVLDSKELRNIKEKQKELEVKYTDIYHILGIEEDCDMYGDIIIKQNRLKALEDYLNIEYTTTPEKKEYIKNKKK